MLLGLISSAILLVFIFKTNKEGEFIYAIVPDNDSIL